MMLHSRSGRAACLPAAAASQDSVLSDRNCRVQLKLRVVLASLVALLLPCFTQAANPVFMEESARVASPDSQFPLNGSVAVYGNHLIASSTIAEGGLYRSAVFLFVRRSATSWSYVQRLADVGPVQAADNQVSVDVVGNTAAIATAGTLQIYEYVGGTWRRKITLAKPATASSFGSDVAISGGVILVGARSEGNLVGYVYERNASRQWVKLRVSLAAQVITR